MMFFFMSICFVFAVGTNTIDTVRKLPLFVTVLGSGSAATANVYEVSEPRVETWVLYKLFYFIFPALMHLLSYISK